MPDGTNADNDPDAPDGPGLSPTWTSSRKDLVGGSLGAARLWFTLGFGIVNEVYYPRVDMPQIRDLGFIVGDGNGFWVEVKRLANYRITLVAPGVPAAEITHEHKRFRLRLRITPDPDRDVLAIELVLTGDPTLRPYVLLAPHLGATGQDNIARIEQRHGRTVLTAEQGPFGLALVAVDDRQRDAISAASAGYVGGSDGWQDFNRNGALTCRHRRAGPGNVALTGALSRTAVLALGFADSTEAATTLALSSVLRPFESLLQRQVADWQAWYALAETRMPVLWEVPEALRDAFRMSTLVLRTHLDKTYPGAMVASLSIPWGNVGNTRGGYHLVWPRDLVMSAGALLALGADDEARDTLRYLIATQREDGHWSQNQWLGGTSYWQGLQLDETAFPVLLAAALAQRDALGGIEVADMTARALGYILANGPSSGQDRWEENRGISAYTLATCIAALVAGARFLPLQGRWLALAVADFWNASIESWIAVQDDALDQTHDIAGHYVRIAPVSVFADTAALRESIPVRNRGDGAMRPAEEEIALDFLQLVRLGLRDAAWPLARDSVTLADALLKVETPAGPAWHRYVDDGYGETDDGRPFTGVGRGRAWPLLAGERGHYELAAGRDPLPLLTAMAAMTSPGGLMPEQVWDAAPIPHYFLTPGAPSGSAMPLVWTHAEFIKLVLSRHLGRPLDRPDAVWQRYRGRPPVIKRACWSPAAPIGGFPAGCRLLVLLPRPALLRWSHDGGPAVETPTHAAVLGLHVAELRTAALLPGQVVGFTLRWADSEAWEGNDIRVSVQPAHSGINTAGRQSQGPS